MKKSTVVVLGVTAAVAAAGLVAYESSDEPPAYSGVCVDKDTGQRVDDGECDDGSGHAPHYVGGYGHLHPSWYYIPTGAVAAAVGHRVAGGSFSAPSGSSYVTGGVSRSGGTVDSAHSSGGRVSSVSRGGFGGKGGGSGS